MKLDILAIGVHPDDVELSCAGTVLKHIQQGKTCGVLDLTKGELGTRGSAKLRMEEANDAAAILGVQLRDNLGFKDGFFVNDEEHQKLIIEKIRLYQPEIVLCNALKDRHPDHGRAGKLVADACFYSGLAKVETTVNGIQQNAWRPKAVYHYVQDQYIQPDFVVDVTDFVDTKMKAINAFRSQFYNPDSQEPESPITSESFLHQVKGKMRVFGRDINADFAEAFNVNRTIGVDNLFDIK